MAGKTEWEDALIKHGIMAAPPVEVKDDEVHYEHVAKLMDEDADEKALGDKGMDSLDELEDDFEEDVLKKYREKRMKELKEAAAKNKYGAVKEIYQQDFIREVSEASSEEGLWVVCHLYVYAKPECQLLNKCMDEVAVKFKAVKFLKIVSTEAIPNYPDANCPTLLIYTKGDIAEQIVGISKFGGLKMNAKILEWVLAASGVLKTEIEENPLNQLGMKIKRKQDIRNFSDSESDLSE